MFSQEQIGNLQWRLAVITHSGHENINIQLPLREHLPGWVAALRALGSLWTFLMTSFHDLSTVRNILASAGS